MAVIAEMEAPQAARAASPLALWHLLSLDAPTVAALWIWFVARVTHTGLSPDFPVAVFLAVWALYAADRLLDGRRTTGLEARHRFHAAHRGAFVAAIPVAIAAAVVLVVRCHLPAGIVEGYAVLAGLLALWFAAIHLTGRRLPKEMAVGIFFAAAIFIPVAHTSQVWLEAAVFAALCTVNCLFINRWESRLPDGPALRSVTLAFFLAAAVVLRSPITDATALAAGLLLLLDRGRDRLDATTLRAAADLALLTPALVVPFLSLLR